MAGDDDLSGLLPRPPLPAPARREAAITEALRRFDGGDAQPAVEPEPRRPWITWPVRGVLAAASLAVLITLPAVWMNRSDPPEQVAGADRSAQPQPIAPPVPMPTDDSGPAYADARGPAGPSTASGPSAAPQPQSSPSPVAPPRGRAPAREEVELAQADIPGEDGSSIVVTGSRIRRQDLTSTTPVTTVGGEEFFVGPGETTAAAARGDWNACTIDDPARDLAACRGAIDPGATGARGQAAAHIADGLRHAWRGEQANAIEAFDRAIAADRRSASAFLNRGLVRQARGDLDRALADLNRAVRYDPSAARVYYHRSRLLRERGDLARARSDMARAVRLDPGYAFLSQPSLPER